MTVTFYVEVVDGDRHTWINHSVTRAEEIDWLLSESKKILDKAFAMKGNSVKNGLFNSIFGKNHPVQPEQKFKNRMGEL